MLRGKFSEIFNQVQQNSSCHQKYSQILLSLYKKTDFEDFQIELMVCLHRLFAVEDVSAKQVNVERCMAFAALFVGVVTKSDKKEDENSSNTFLNLVIRDVVQYHNLDCVSARYRCCQFINLVLDSIGSDADISVDIWNAIEVAMLERTLDPKPNIRLQSIKALMRLQVPLNSECPVIKALVSHLLDCSPMVRKEVVEILAPNPTTIPRLVDRSRDTDYTVRLATYRKFSVIGPRALRIIDRQSIIDSGFNERHEGVKQLFLKDTLPKWLAAYNGDFLKLLSALKLDAYEEDIKHTEIVCRNVLEQFFKSYQFTHIVEYLPIGQDKLIPIDKLNNESVLFWCILNHYLRKSEKTEEYTEDILPELSPFCNYILKVQQTKSEKRMEHWEFLEYQYILSKLFIMAGEYDLSDEVGRQSLNKIIIEIFTNAKLEQCVIKEMIAILMRITPVIDTFTINICHLISDIREPMIVQPHSAGTVRDHEFKLAQLNLQIDILNEDLSDAVSSCNFQVATVTKDKLTELNKQVEKLVSDFESSRGGVKETQNDPNTLCKCLDILVGVLSSPMLKSLTVSLRACRNEFVVPLQESDNVEIALRVYKSIMLYCLLDEPFTRDCIKYICTPLILYRLIPNYDKNILLVSIAAISDLLRLYGVDIFGSSNDTTSNTSKHRSNSTRRLYRMSHLDDVESFDFSSFTVRDIIDIFLDMIDDEIEEMRVQACKALCELIKDNIAVSSSLMCRLILKWFSPLTEKHESKLQQCLGTAIMYYAQCVEGSEEVLEKALLPSLTSIGNAPHTSPLADIDIENALGFLAALTSIEKSTGYVNSHKNLAFELCFKISLRPDDKCVPLYIKMLHHLELMYLEEMDVVKELINQSKIIIEELDEKAPKKNMEKFMAKLTALLFKLENKNIVSNHASMQSLDNQGHDSLLLRNDTSANESQENIVVKKQKRLRNSSLLKDSLVSDASSITEDNSIQKDMVKLRELVVNVTPLDLAKLAREKTKHNLCSNRTYSDETILHTIIEEVSEMGILDDDEEDTIISQSPPPKPSIVENDIAPSKKGTKRKEKAKGSSSLSSSSAESLENGETNKTSSGSPKQKILRRQRNKRKCK